jgi:hypothetical protein
MKAIYTVQKNDSSSETDDYMRGMFNGMELMMAIVEKRNPAYKEVPQPESQIDKWARKHL